MSLKVYRGAEEYGLHAVYKITMLATLESIRASEMDLQYSRVEKRGSKGRVTHLLIVAERPISQNTPLGLEGDLWVCSNGVQVRSTSGWVGWLEEEEVAHPFIKGYVLAYHTQHCVVSYTTRFNRQNWREYWQKHNNAELIADWVSARSISQGATKKALRKATMGLSADVEAECKSFLGQDGGEGRTPRQISYPKLSVASIARVVSAIWGRYPFVSGASLPSASSSLASQSLVRPNVDLLSRRC
jgi:hypothetical protein